MLSLSFFDVCSFLVPTGRKLIVKLLKLSRLWLIVRVRYRIYLLHFFKAKTVLIPKSCLVLLKLVMLT